LTELFNKIETETATLSLLIDFIQRQSQLEYRARKGSLVSEDLVFLKQVENTLKDYVKKIEKIRELNRHN